MKGRRRHPKLPNWVIPTAYAIAAIAIGLTFPRFEPTLLPRVQSGLSTTAALAIYTSVGTGMLAMTGIVFSLVFVMVQFSAIAYSPRLSLWIARDSVIWHSLGVFTATFLYSMAAIGWLDRDHSGTVLFFSGWLVVVLLFASVAMFIALVERITVLQINRMLAFTGDHGRGVIEKMYPPLETPIAMANPEEFQRVQVTQTLLHAGRPRTIQALDTSALLQIAFNSGGIVEVVCSVGDTVVEGTLLLRIHGGREKVNEDDLRRTFEMGAERTFEQDPKYAIRLLVDIAIKALSPAINDPTTAVQALDQIEDLLLRLGRRRLEVGALRDSGGALKLVIPGPTWEDFIILAFDEIRYCGAKSVQVMRRMKALASDLIAALPPERHAPLRHYRARLNATIARSFEDAEEQQDASIEDRQGLGGPRRTSPTP
ncbi:MAG TPA: DUF2254 domain-containing protein [Candidatus Sulfotelmatobacter sp.]|nr:DUF2254 domain-containing protein [Candidatus Sulfotelmatobacter sp.]